MLSSFFAEYEICVDAGSSFNQGWWLLTQHNRFSVFPCHLPARHRTVARLPCSNTLFAFCLFKIRVLMQSKKQAGQQSYCYQPCYQYPMQIRLQD